MRLLFTIIVFLLIGCTKPKTVLICGDHICVNKKEAKLGAAAICNGGGGASALIIEKK